MLTMAKVWNKSQCPLITNWIKKVWHTYIMHYYSAIQKNIKQKNEISSFVTAWMALPGIMLSEMSHSEKYNYHTIPLTRGG